jgi:hypothetical protein
MPAAPHPQPAPQSCIPAAHRPRVVVGARLGRWPTRSVAGNGAQPSLRWACLDVIFQFLSLAFSVSSSVLRRSHFFAATYLHSLTIVRTSFAPPANQDLGIWVYHQPTIPFLRPSKSVRVVVSCKQGPGQKSNQQACISAQLKKYKKRSITFFTRP